MKQGIPLNKAAPKEDLMGNKVTLKKIDPIFSKVIFDSIDKDRKRLLEYLPFPKFIKNVQDESIFIKKKIEEWSSFSCFCFGIFSLDSNVFMGNISAFSINWEYRSLELGYWILGEFEGQGFMTDAVKVLEKEFRNIGFNRVVIRCDANNKRSSSIPKKLAFSLEGVLRDAKVINGRYCDVEVYAKVKRDVCP